ncbi:hypothetical protein KFE80_09855 [bacterium SCSIO 12696]|nr:hypothetical protein KFE80_09855 [bacterium SCSIO 12696]
MSRLLALLCAAAVCGGCAFNNAINRGDQQFTGGNYERAVEAYQQALITKPDSVKAQQKLAIAQQQLDIWSDQIAAAASRSEQSQLSGLAAVLYQKQSQLRGDSAAATRAAKLRRKLTQAYAPQVFVTGDAELISTTEQPTQTYRSGEANHIPLKVTAGQPVFDVQEFEATGSYEYVSGTITRSNPEYLVIEDDLQSLHYQLEQLREQEHYQQSGIGKQEHRLAKRKGALDEQRRLLSASTPGTTEHTDIQQRISELKQRVRQSKDQLASLQSDLKDTLHQLQKCERDYHHLEDELAATPVEIIEDVYATYTYPVLEVVQTATLELSFTQGNEQQNATVTYRYDDQVFTGDSRIGLNDNPRDPLSRAELRQSVLAKGAERVAQQAALIGDDYRQQLLDQAFQQPDQQGKLDRLIRYALSSDQPMSPDTYHLTNQLLRTEFGTGGNLDVYQLLKK